MFAFFKKIFGSKDTTNVVSVPPSSTVSDWPFPVGTPGSGSEEPKAVQHVVDGHGDVQEVAPKKKPTAKKKPAGEKKPAVKAKTARTKKTKKAS